MGLLLAQGIRAKCRQVLEFSRRGKVFAALAAARDLWERSEPTGAARELPEPMEESLGDVRGVFERRKISLVERGYMKNKEATHARTHE